MMRTRLEVEVLQHLKTLIKDGVFSGTLPGIYALAGELGVSRRPVESALKRLESEGWISAVRPGGRRQVIEPKSEKTNQLRVAVFTPPIESLLSTLLRESLRRVEATLEKEGVSLVRVTVSEERGEVRDWRRRVILSQSGSLDGLDAVVLMFVQPEFVHACGIPKLPILELGKLESSENRVSRVFFNVSKVMRAFFAGCLKQGMSQVSFVQWDVHPSWHLKQEANLIELFEEHGEVYIPELHLPWLESSRLESQLELLMRREPKVIVCRSAQSWVRLMLSPSVRYSRSEICSLLNDDSFMRCQHPPVGVEINYEEFNWATLDWLNLVRSGDDSVFEHEVGVEICRNQRG